MGGPIGSYATAGIALRVIAPRKPPYPAIMPSSNSRTATGTYIDTLLTGQDPAVSNCEGPEYSVQSIIFLISQNRHVTCTGCSEREHPCSSSLESGKEPAPSLM